MRTSSRHIFGLDLIFLFKNQGKDEEISIQFALKRSSARLDLRAIGPRSSLLAICLVVNGFVCLFVFSGGHSPL